MRHLDGSFGKGGFEGVALDNQGNITLAEDAGGVSAQRVIKGDVTSPKVAKQPNSFIYRFEPYNKADLSVGGRLFALQVIMNGTPLAFHAADPVGDTFSDNQVRHPRRSNAPSWPVSWVLLQTTPSPMANHAVRRQPPSPRSKLATPFKRPENLKFLPGSNFETFSSSARPAIRTRTPAINPHWRNRGSWGSIFRVNFPSGERDRHGLARIAVLGDADHASF